MTRKHFVQQSELSKSETSVETKNTEISLERLNAWASIKRLPFYVSFIVGVYFVIDLNCFASNITSVYYRAIRWH